MEGEKPKKLQGVAIHEQDCIKDDTVTLVLIKERRGGSPAQWRNWPTAGPARASRRAPCSGTPTRGEGRAAAPRPRRWRYSTVTQERRRGARRRGGRGSGAGEGPRQPWGSRGDRTRACLAKHGGNAPAAAWWECLGRGSWPSWLRRWVQAIVWRAKRRWWLRDRRRRRRRRRSLQESDERDYGELLKEMKRTKWGCSKYKAFVWALPLHF